MDPHPHRAQAPGHPHANGGHGHGGHGHGGHPHGAPAHGAGPHAPVDPAAPKKTALLEIVRSDNGEATYKLLIDGVDAKLKASGAKWDDASPWPSGNYGAAFSPLHGRTDAFLIKYPPNRSDIKFHQGTVTAHSEGCIVTRLPNIEEIVAKLDENHIARNEMRFNVIGDYGIGFKLSTLQPDTVGPGEKAKIKLELTGPGALGGVTKDIWFHIRSENAQFGREFTLAPPETLPRYQGGRTAPVTGFWVRLPAGQQTGEFLLEVNRPKALASQRLVTLAIDTYRIVNAAAGHVPYFYTPSDYAQVINADCRTSFSLKAVTEVPHPAAAPTRTGFRGGLHPAHARR